QRSRVRQKSRGLSNDVREPQTNFFASQPRSSRHEYYKQGEIHAARKVDVAVLIGSYPSIFLASQFVPGIDVDEFTIAGALRQKPVELVRCETVDIEVPATAEIVLEGQVSIPAEIGDEGPYGEFCGDSVGTAPRERV